MPGSRADIQHQARRKVSQPLVNLAFGVTRLQPAGRLGNAGHVPRSPDRCPMKALLIGILSTLAVITAAFPALAQQNCAPIDQVAAKLAAEYRETRVGQGITASGSALLAIFASPTPRVASIACRFGGSS